MSASLTESRAFTWHQRAASAIAALDPAPQRKRAARIDARLLWPSGNPHLNSGFGYRAHPFDGTVRLHQGVDVRAECGSPVMAAAAGVVSFAGWTDSAGNTVKVTHEHGLVTMYAHLSELRISTGDKVAQGELLGLSGNTGALTTGPHLHFEVWRGRVAQNPMQFRYRHVAVETPPHAAMAGCERGAPVLAVGSREDEHPREDAAEFATAAYARFIGQ